MGGSVTLASVELDDLDAREVVSAVMGALDRREGGLLVTPNVDIVRLAQDPDVAPLVRRATLRVCDGAPLLWAARLAGSPLRERVTGADLIWSLSAAAAERGRSVYVIGGPPGVADEALRRLAEHHPGLVPAGAATPQAGFEDRPAEVAALCRDVVACDPDIVYAALGFPKQERLALLLAEQCPSAWFVGCGAAVEFVAGTRHRAPRWLQRWGLEWSFRLLQEPRRLGPRYARDAVFILQLLVESAASGLRRRWSRGSGAVDAEGPGDSTRRVFLW